MYRSWAYILMILATLVGIVALVWPSPQVQTIEQIASVTRDVAPRAEAPAKAPKSPAKAQAKAKPAAEPAPPAVLKKMPAPNTTTRRAGPLLQNGLEVPAVIPEQKSPPPPPSRGGQMTTRPPLPPRPPAATRPGSSTPTARPPHDNK
jgi:hypothetical protein